jgi:hypothetical protein
MSDQLADRLKRLAEQHAKGKRAESDEIAFQQRVASFISGNARGEFERLLRLVKENAERVNPTLGELPQYRLAGHMVQQGNMAAYFSFDQPIINHPDNALMLTVAPAPNTIYFFGDAPEPVRFRMQAAASDQLDRIVWVGDLSEVSSEQLADLALEQLTTYYLENKR